MLLAPPNWIYKPLNTPITIAQYGVSVGICLPPC